ncbi:MAG: hypothetical protein KAT66_04425 [Candidatus Lokiarchaeota archaeon]|nr:hypothetical protein [Candidatus Lokiarchaeota archaeon]
MGCSEGDDLPVESTGHPKLAGFDEHLNLYLEETSQIFEYQDEDGNIREEHENLGSIVVRGDNVIFVNLANVEGK